MNKYILIAFAVMGAAYWYLSGGAYFTPQTRAPEDQLATRLLPLEDVAPLSEPLFVPVEPAPSAPEPSAQSTPAPEPQTPPSFTELVGAGLEATPEAPQEPIVLDLSSAPLQADLRVVTGDSVNMREGPGTNFDVVARLTRGDEVAVLDTDSSGWQHIRVTATGVSGWMSGRFLAFPE